MRIALVMRGHYRTFNTTGISWINALKDYDYDCFFHTWNLQDCTTATLYRGNKYALELRPAYIDHLKSFDKDVVIQEQNFSEEELSDLYTGIAFKGFIYRFEALRDTLNRIPQDTYDIIIVGRYDLFLKSGIFDNLSVKEDEILIGGRKDENYLKGYAATDLIFAFHPKNISKFFNQPKDYTEKKFNNGEEGFTDFLYSSFKKVNIKWVYNFDFAIRR